MFEQIPEFVKTALYESASTNHEFDENGDEILIIVYERTDVERWRNFLKMEEHND